MFIAACGGGGGGGGGSSDSAAPGQPATTGISIPALPTNNSTILSCPTTSNFSVATPPVAAAGKISGRITYDRVPFFPPAPSYQPGPGLDYDNPHVTPARGVVVEIVASSNGVSCAGEVIATTLTDGDGWYEATVGTASNVCLRVRAQLYRATDFASGANWNIAVADNTSSDAMYVMTESSATSANASPRRDLHAQSGWSNGAYNGARVAAPFAILDTACKAINAVLASNADAQFGSLSYFWSTKNTSDSNGTLAQGKIGGAFFSASTSAIYLRGDAAIDTDEFDEMVIAHEFGHFITRVFSRSDSLGGEHSLFDYMDPRVAFDEGWATAFAALALNTPIYRDSDEVTTMHSSSREFFFNVQDRFGGIPTGWFSESSVQRALFNIGADSSYGGLGLGIDGLMHALSGTYKTTPALATLFSYGSQLIDEQASSAMADDIATILNDEDVDGSSIQPFAEFETHAPDPDDLPVYANISANGGAVSVCSGNDYGTGNTLSNRRYLRFDVAAAGRYQFTVEPETGFSGAVAGFELLQRGARLTYQQARSGSLSNRTARYPSGTLSAGAYVLSAFHVGNVVAGSGIVAGRQCFKVTVSAAP